MQSTDQRNSSSNSSRSNTGAARRGQAIRGGRGAAGSAGRGGRQPTLAARAPRETAQVIGAPVPQELADVLNNLRQQVDTIPISAATLIQLKDLLQQLHGRQTQIEMALRLHAGQKPVPALCRAMLRFVNRLDEALQGPPRTKAYKAPSAPPRERLPLNALEIDDLESLCLALSSFAYSRNRQPFPADQRAAAGETLASLTGKLMRQAQALGGEKSMSNGQLLNIGNMPRRFLAAGLIDIRQEAQQATRTFMQEEFNTFCAWADKKHTLDSAHDLGKAASLVLTMVDSGLAMELSDLARVLAWLLGKEALARMREEGNTVALSSVVSLVTRLLQRKKFKPGNRDLDQMWSRLTANIGALDAQALVGSDGRTLASYANLLAEMLAKGLPKAWQTAYEQFGNKDDARAQQLLGLIRQFEGATSNVLGAICDPAFKRLADLQSLSVLLKFVANLSRQNSEAFQANLQAAAAALLGVNQLAQVAPAVEPLLREIQALRQVAEQDIRQALAAIRMPVHAHHAKEKEEEVPLQLDDDDDASLHARCTRPPELVGGSLAQIQQPAPKPEPSAHAPLLPHALSVADADRFREATRVARERPQDARPSRFPIPVPGEVGEQEAPTTTSAITSTTSATSATTTTTTTRITTTTAIDTQVTTTTLAGNAGKRKPTPAGKAKTKTFTKHQRSRLMNAVSSGNTDEVQSLLKSGVAAALSIDQRRYCLRTTVENAGLDMLVLLLQEKLFLPALDATTLTGASLLMWALEGTAAEQFSDERRQSFDSIARHLITHIETREQAAVRDMGGVDALSMVVALNREAHAELLLQYPEFRNLIAVPGLDGQTPLMTAVLNESLPMVQTLLKCEEAKAALDVEWRGLQALEHAAVKGDAEMFKSLWALHRKQGKKNARFKRPPMLPFAAVSGELAMVRHVLGIEEFKASAGDADRNGVSALMYALMEDNADMVSELLKSPAVCASLFQVFKVPPADHNISKPPLVACDAVTLAISKGGPLADLMLGLPQVEAKLRDDQAFCKTLLILAEGEKHHTLVNKLLKFVKE